MEQYKLGQTVKYIRAHYAEGTDEYTIQQGEGKVKAIILDPNLRPAITIYDPSQSQEQNTFNVPYGAVNPTQEIIDAYPGITQSIKDATNEANDNQKKAVTDGNAKISEILDKAFGNAVEL